MIHFVFDHLGPYPDLGHPNLVPLDLPPDQVDGTWPYCLPLRLIMYFRRAGIKFCTHTIDQAPQGSWYPVAIGWHDHDLDYFSLMSPEVIQALRCRRMRVLFYYHEGDNPYRIKELMDQRVAKNQLPQDCYLWVSANGASAQISNFFYFPDHEHFFQYINRHQEAVQIEIGPRPFQFTALNRTHKWWRATVMSDLWSQGLLHSSQWSYNTGCDIGDDARDNPIMLSALPRWQKHLNEFIAGGPYWWDSADSDQHNDHRHVNTDLYHKSYCHLVLETLFDSDGSNGSFITEKTYKCLKFGQPFVVIGAPHSLESLRSNGYKVFDHVLDNSYDTITDNTERWLAIRKLLADLACRDMHKWFLNCADDLRHNQLIFQRTQKPDLLDLAQHLDTV